MNIVIFRCGGNNAEQGGGSGNSGRGNKHGLETVYRLNMKCVKTKQYKIPCCGINVVYMILSVVTSTLPNCFMEPCAILCKT